MERVTEFRVSPAWARNNRNDRIVRLALWGAVLALVGVIAVAFVGYRDPRLDTVLVWAAAIIVVGAVAAAYLLAYRNGMRRVMADATIRLSDSELIARRPGWPDKRIVTSRISRMVEGRDWLIVEGGDPAERILVPKAVEGFRQLRAELLHYGAIAQQREASIIALLPVLASLFCWALVVLSKEAGVVKAGRVRRALIALLVVLQDCSHNASSSQTFCDLGGARNCVGECNVDILQQSL